MAEKQLTLNEIQLSNSLIQRRRLPAELLNELFGSLPLQNAFGLLAKMPNCFLARNVQKILNNIKMEMKSNKWNEQDCGPKLSVSEDGLMVVVHSVGSNRWNSVRSVSPIPAINLAISKSKIAFYYEVQILALNWNAIRIGFSTQQFQLKNKLLGYENSIGIFGRKELWVDGSNLYGNGNDSFIEGNVVGIGIIYSPFSMHCFATCNGKLLEKRELPEKFASLQLFPTVSLLFGGQSIRANFGKEKWCFKLRQSSRMRWEKRERKMKCI